jgi:hypothetical protein
MSGVMIEFPISEAKALEKRLAGRHLTSLEEESVMSAAQRLSQALDVERGASGSAKPDIADEVRALVGQNIRITTNYGCERRGKLLELASTEIAVLDRDAIRQPIAIAMVRSVALDEEPVAA